MSTDKLEEDNHVHAPFTLEQVVALNAWQVSGQHPFTCGGEHCGDRRKQPNEGALIAGHQGWECPCGRYRQLWAHRFMAQPQASQPQPVGIKTAEIKKISVGFCLYLVNLINQGTYKVDETGLVKDPDNELTANDLFDRYIKLPDNEKYPWGDDD